MVTTNKKYMCIAIMALLLANLTGFQLRVTGSMEAGLVEIGNLPNGTSVFETGVAVQVLLDLQKLMNFSIKSCVVDDFFPETIVEGSSLTNSTIAYQLATEKADIAIGLLYHVLYRLKFAKPLISFSNDLFYAYFQQPTNIMEHNNVFQKPFQPQLAGAIVLLLFAIGIFAEYSTLIDASKVSRTHLLQTLVNAIEWVVATISQQGNPPTSSITRRSYVKLSLYAGSLLSVWLYAYYSAAILSYFTLDQEIIQRFSQIPDNGFTVYAISSINASIPVQSANGISFNHADVDYYKSLELIFQGNHAHMDTMDLFYVAVLKSGKTKEEVCTISKVQVDGGIIRSGFYCRFNFPHKEVFGIGILKVRESGLTHKYFTNYLDSVITTCPKVKKQYHEDLGMDELWTLYASYFCYMIASTVILGMEMILMRYFGTKSNKNDILYTYSHK